MKFSSTLVSLLSTVGLLSSTVSARGQYSYGQDVYRRDAYLDQQAPRAVYAREAAPSYYDGRSYRREAAPEEYYSDVYAREASPDYENIYERDVYTDLYSRDAEAEAELYNGDIFERDLESLLWERDELLEKLAMQRRGPIVDAIKVFWRSGVMSSAAKAAEAARQKQIVEKALAAHNAKVTDASKKIVEAEITYVFPPLLSHLTTSLSSPCRDNYP